MNRNPLQGDVDRFRAIFQKEITDQYHAGKIEKEDYDVAMRRSERNRVVHEMINEANRHGDFNWVRVVDWVKEHWWDILKIALTLAILFLDGEEETNGRPKES